MRDDLKAVLAQIGFTPHTLSHPPVHTVDDAHQYYAGLEGVHTKNAFLKDVKGKLFLVTVPAEQRLDMKALPQLIGSKRLSFASAELMRSVLETEPGSLGPLSLIADKDKQVTFAIDSALLAADKITCHPLDNTQTWVIPRKDLQSFLGALHIEPVVFSWPEETAAS